MPKNPAMRFVIALLCGLALLTWAATALVNGTARRWFEKDTTRRARLAISGARHSLVSHWSHEERPALQAVLAELTRDDRIVGVAACGKDLSTLAVTGNVPPQFSCSSVGAHVRSLAGAASDWAAWETVASLSERTVHVSAVPVFDANEPVGFMVVVHDLSFVERRESTMRGIVLVVFGILAVAASGVTILAARMSWRQWSDAIQQAVRGESQGPAFRPLLQDVRELVERLAAERQADNEAGVWTPHRLRYTLNRHLCGDKIVILANREPYIHDRATGNGVKVVRPASGLVTALEPVMRACSGVWIANGTGSADRETADAGGRLRVPPGEESYVLRRVWLSPDEEKGYYYGFANEGLWPLCHIAHARPVFRRKDWQHYRTVNERFADAVSEEVDVEDPIVLVQDYHFALAPRLLRERLPRATIIAFWHIPWPNPERFGICPWRTELLDGLLGSNVVGFHTRYHCNNFIDTVDRYIETRIDRAEQAIVRSGRTSLVRPYPISTEWPVNILDQVPSAAECRRIVFAELNLPSDALLGVGVDRLDYTKGIEERLLAVERLLENGPLLRGRFTFVQLAAPSRTEIERYRDLSANVEEIADRINQRFGRENYRPIVLLVAHHEPKRVFTYYRAADVCYVSSLHDGMNLVAKEFVAARDDERGVLVLSQFTGAAHELAEALIVNPYDLDEAAAALASALRMPAEEQAARVRSMRAYMSEFNVYRWAGRMLVEAARLRDRDRIAGHFARATPTSRNSGVDRRAQAASMTSCGP